MTETDKMGDDQSGQADLPQEKGEHEATMVEEPKAVGASPPTTKDEKYKKLKQRFDALKKVSAPPIQNYLDSKPGVVQVRLIL